MLKLFYGILEYNFEHFDLLIDVVFDNSSFLIAYKPKDKIDF